MLLSARCLKMIKYHISKELTVKMFGVFSLSPLWFWNIYSPGILIPHRAHTLISPTWGEGKSWIWQHPLPTLPTITIYLWDRKENWHEVFVPYPLSSNMLSVLSGDISKLGILILYLLAIYWHKKVHARDWSTVELRFYWLKKMQ